ncbi:hypothetical protein GPJ56_008581 [Histomonas meleagridis]|uniref:uncharacterized protein n=1 Tax=Histomonas meleagridis TaxID=135588 RepID=UPI00355A9DE2|nr:hypothetical protein GPJ56_008581 [Histomonas meleagridis]KAH0805842.1 hypothetical protein GO595_001481 [Histomonas meleagridis]
MDPLDKNNGVFDFSKSKNPIMDAFEMAASSLAVHKQVPNAKFYQIPTEPPKQQNIQIPNQPSQPQKPDAVPKQIPPKPSLPPQIAVTTNELPVPSNVTIYPPPIADESDPDRTRLLHSWYWAGYYTGLADGKRISSHPNVSQN